MMILSLLEENVKRNELSNVCLVKGLDWQNEESVTSAINGLEDLNYLIAADVFYDICTFRPLITTICHFFDRFPKLRFYFSYAVRDGASASKLVFVNTSGKTLAEASTSGTNYNLDGIERTASFIATWVRETAAKNNIALPLKGLGLGLSGAEGARDNALFIDYLKVHHGDVADHLYLASDAVATVAAAFEQGRFL
ncbi:hypothetical protein OSTOST_04971, partial [Ostertagia ostertagi]